MDFRPSEITSDALLEYITSKHGKFLLIVLLTTEHIVKCVLMHLYGILGVYYMYAGGRGYVCSTRKMWRS